jgi:type I site-specific restriction endonuclease
VANEAFARVKIDQLLLDTDWKLTDGRSVRFEYPLDDGGKADYALFDPQGRALAVLEAKSTSVNLSSGEAQGRRYTDQIDVPFIFLSNGEEVWFCDKVSSGLRRMPLAALRRTRSSWLNTVSTRRKCASCSDGQVKRKAAKVLAEMGLSVSDAIRLLLVRVAV